MSLTREQLEAIVARALPGERLRESHALAGERYSLALVSGERLCAQLYATRAEAATAAEALRMLRGEVDLPIPELHASDPDGETIGAPYVLTGEVAGEPLGQVVGRLDDEQSYRLGRRLGQIVQRVHRLACTRYGALPADATDTQQDERSYVVARLDHDARRCGELGLLDRKSGGEIAAWFDAHFKPVGRQPALTHGGLGPQSILARQAEGGWKMSGLLGWGEALGWSPAWDHVVFLDTTEDARFFSLRVGYGNGYDELTQRAYEQVREHALAPYRVLLTLRRMCEAAARGDVAEAQRRRGVLRGLMRILDM
jgi:aminoglycoside phosphotransferase (APT) family kinase protein